MGGAHRKHVPPLLRLAPYVTAVAIGTGSVLLGIDPSRSVPVAAPITTLRAPDIPPRPVTARPSPAIAAAPSVMASVPVPSCGDYTDVDAAQAALDGAAELAVHLDTDGDSLACEIRFPRAEQGVDEDAPPATAIAAAGSECPSALDGTRPHVARAGHHLDGRFDIASIGGRADRARGGSDHPTGHALDFTVDRDAGDALADYALAHADELAVKYVIWRQRINHGSGWELMEDRGGATANHFDHVHVSFDAEAGAGLPC